MIIGKRLKDIRKLRQLTQNDLAKLAGITKSSICCYEKGRRTPTLDTLQKIADILSVDFTYLLGQESYIVAEDEETYGMNISKDEMNIIKKLRNNSKLYINLLNDNINDFKE